MTEIFSRQRFQCLLMTYSTHETQTNVVLKSNSEESVNCEIIFIQFWRSCLFDDTTSWCIWAQTRQKIWSMIDFRFDHISRLINVWKTFLMIDSTTRYHWHQTDITSMWKRIRKSFDWLHLTWQLAQTLDRGWPSIPSTTLIFDNSSSELNVRR